LPAWNLLLPFVIAMLLLDVAARRIAWDARLIRRAVIAAITRVAPARQKGEESKATLAALRQRNELLEQGVADVEATVTMPRAGHLPAPAAPEPAIDEETRQSRIRAALHALEGKKPQPPPSSPPAPTSAPSPSGDEEPTATTSGLLAAKKRIRDQMEGRGPS
jgi:hypothetical protein